VDLERLEALALEREVSFAQGCEFHIHAAGGPFIRLAFGWSRVADIYEGIARLARCMEQASARRGDVG
jgi:DNA-binding transcriptional MocR family regulator